MVWNRIIHLLPLCGRIKLIASFFMRDPIKIYFPLCGGYPRISTIARVNLCGCDRVGPKHPASCHLFDLWSSRVESETLASRPGPRTWTAHNKSLATFTHTHTPPMHNDVFCSVVTSHTLLRFGLHALFIIISLLSHTHQPRHQTNRGHASRNIPGVTE
jgi:hypothetical protein